MGAHKRTEITIETYRILTIRRSPSIRAFCRRCGCEVDVVSLAEAGALTGIQQLTLAEALPAWHVSEVGDEAAICLPSLLKAM